MSPLCTAASKACKDQSLQHSWGTSAGAQSPVGLGGVTYVQTMSVVLEQNWLEQAWGKVP